MYGIDAFESRDMRVDAMKMADWLAMAGGLALFLYGIYLMGEGLAGSSSETLARLLKKLAGSPGRAVWCGAGVTAVLQSSSAVTVMTVGLVNAGLMELRQAAGVIMGANIGTTATAWLLGLAGRETDSVWTGLLSPLSLAPLLGLAGVAVLMGSARPGVKRAASVMMGFAILMFGMDSMSGSVRPLATAPEFAGMLTKISHPLRGLAAGVCVTALLQSSSASVGILQALCATKAISYGTAVPIILGQNIGSCATALLSAVGAGKNARRTALVHLYFNGIGSGIFLLLFYGLRAVCPQPFLRAADGFGIAFIHSAFNITATLILFPFLDELVGLARLTVPEGGHKKASAYADAP